MALPSIRLNAPVTILYFFLALAVTCADMVMDLTGPLAAFGPPRLTVEYGLRLLGSPLVHGDLTHLFGNFAFLLLLGPVLENRFGSKRVLLMFLVTGAVVAALHGLLFPGGLIGASGVVFMAVMLVAYSSARGGGIPLTFLLIAALFLGKEILASLNPDQVSQFAHLAGGALGVLFGAFYRSVRLDGSSGLV
ncbi:MAG: rhomboid family intramembrane serine protease [Rhodospirillaceae bacterium]